MFSVHISFITIFWHIKSIRIVDSSVVLQDWVIFQSRSNINVLNPFQEIACRKRYVTIS